MEETDIWIVFSLKMKIAMQKGSLLSVCHDVIVTRWTHNDIIDVAMEIKKEFKKASS